MSYFLSDARVAELTFRPGGRGIAEALIVRLGAEIGPSEGLSPIEHH